MEQLEKKHGGKLFQMTNWDALMHRYKPEHYPLIKKVQGAVDLFKKKWDSPLWKEVTNDKKENLVIWQRVSEEGLNTVKASGFINRDPMLILRVTGDDKYRHQYDPMYDRMAFLERIADQTYLIHHLTKSVVVVGARDFVVIIHFNKTPEGVIYAIVLDAGRNDLVPETKGTVRGYLPIAGWRLEALPPQPGIPHRTKVDYLAEIDIKGNIPAFLMKVVIKDQGY